MNVLSLRIGTPCSQNEDKESVKLDSRVQSDWGNELMIYALNNGQGTMSQSKLFQKPLQKIDEYVDEPKVDIRKMKQLTGEIKVPVSKKQWSIRGAVTQFYYDLKFYLGLDGKHERTKREVNRKLLVVAALTIPVVFLGVQECQKSASSGSPSESGAAISASVQAQLTRSKNIVDAATKGDAAAISNAFEGTTAGQATTVPEQLEPASAAVAQYSAGPAPLTVMQPVGRHAPRTIKNFYATEEEFWRAHPDLARSVKGNKFGQTAAGQADTIESGAPASGGYSNAGNSTEMPTSATPSNAEAPAATPARQVSNAHNQMHM